MKKILIFIVVLIVLFFAYSEYKDYKRFHPENANITASETIDLNYHNQETVYNYFNALEDANNYMQMQWSANEIDVRSPESDDEETVLAVAEYGKKTAKLNYYQSLLEASKKLKDKGLSNETIKSLEETGKTIEDHNKQEAINKQKQMLINMMPEKSLYYGQRGAFVYELQKLLIKHGADIALDGVFERVTSDALKDFEAKNGLYPDGKVDIISFKRLLN